ncbi:MAG: hypothetical protein ACFE8M_08880 [Candidatus Hermodarchaeota archaeon]
MSKVIKWKYNDFFSNQLRREKLINMLLCEIIFLKTQINKYKLNDPQNHIKQGLTKLEYLLNILKNNDYELSDSDFDKIIRFIYETFKIIVENLE